MRTHFFSASDFFKLRKFELEVPAYYHAHVPKDMIEKRQPTVSRIGRIPVKQLNPQSQIVPRFVFDPNQLQRALYSCEVMVDMFKKKIEFRIIDPKDIVEIFDGVDRYLISIKTDVECKIESFVDYAKVVLEWRKELYKHYFRYMKQNPGALRNLYPTGKPGGDLLSILASLTGDNEYTSLDPLVARGKPPYSLDEIGRPAEIEHEVALSSKYGIPNADSILNDDGKSFDFEDFLSRGRK